MEEFRATLEKLGIKPQNLSLYQTAFTHRSYLNEARGVTESNERLEFLGDSVLSLITSTFLFEKRPSDNEGDLTNLRAYIVKTDSLAKVAQKLELGHFLKLSKGEELSGGRENPQLMANTYEAVLGAIYLDLGLQSATSFVNQTLLPLFAPEVEKGAPRDPKSQLQEVVQSKFRTSPKYKILAAYGPDHAKQFTVGVFVQGEQIGEGSGSSKQQAEEEAAKKALEKLEE
ncbi:MAG: ribonuclease III [Patescibacteria group bacterium]|nr:ribonuclease III [Patescibacteria group bacterium]